MFRHLRQLFRLSARQVKCTQCGGHGGSHARASDLVLGHICYRCSGDGWIFEDRRATRERPPIKADIIAFPAVREPQGSLSVHGQRNR